MTRKQLRQLNKLSEAFSEGHASHLEIRQLSTLLAEINFHHDNNQQEKIKMGNAKKISMANI